MSETELVARLKDPAQRREAFSMVIHRYQQPLYWQIRRLVLIHDDASDVLQNTLLKAWQGLDNFRGEARLSTWLYSIAHNEALTFLAHRQAEQELTLDDPEGYLMDSQEADKYFEGDKAQRLLLEAIALLPPRQREVFNYRYYDELPYEEISAITGITEGALKASYHFAVEKITAYVQKNEV